MRPFARALLVASAIALPLGGCAGIDFDPGELLAFDWFNTKKPLPGERKPVFPEGVPGVSRGMPPELVKGNQSQLVAEPEPVVATEPAAVVEEPKARPKAKAKPKPKPQAAARPPAEPQDDGVGRSRHAATAAAATQPQRQQPPPQRPQPQQQQVQWPDAAAAAPAAAGAMARSAERASAAQPQVQWPDPPRALRADCIRLRPRGIDGASNTRRLRT